MSKEKHGVIVELQKGYVFICETGDDNQIKENEIWLAAVKGKFGTPKDFHNLCVGDLVSFMQSTSTKSSGLDLPYGKIVAVKKRGHVLVKPTRRSPKDFAANFQRLLLLEDMSNLNAGFLCRYLCLTELQGIPVTAVANKSDLDSNSAAILDYCEGIGIDCLRLSALEQSGEFGKLKTLTSSGTHVLVGRSGVGKSTLLNALEPKLLQATDELRRNNFGRHVTSYASMHRVASGGWIMDSPGIQVLTLKGYYQEEIRWGFKEFQGHAENCKFRDCLHIREEKCGIQQAVEEKKIPQWRYDSYCSLMREAQSQRNT